ncbi:MAG: glycoside hydrolase [Lachnospiraceae bacterium]|nr:glycoside hydrolase [Lachnospiraceae bacterium]MBR1817131.1 glycoside hydrolase [Lachnospiraceae bacterium]
MNRNRIIIKILMVCIIILGIAAVILGAILAGRYLYNAGADRKHEETTTEETTEITTEATETTTEETTEEITTEEVAEATPDDAESEEDITAPILLVLNSEPQIKQWENFDVHKYIGYADDWDPTPTFEVDGNVDTSTLGSYPLRITITDASGNVTETNMTVDVVTEVTQAQPRPAIEFSDFINTYKTSSTEVGIDVSRWQGSIDFNLVKEAGCEFVIIRVGGYDDGEVYVDSNYYSNIRNAKAAGLKVGIYYHAEESSIEEVKDNVAWLMGVLDGEELDFPIAYDWEDFANFESYEISLHDINDIYETFYDEITSYGYDAMLYSSKNFLQILWTNENNTPVWLAHYIDRTDYTGDYIMWQKGNTGRIAGISGDVDFNVLYIE